MIRFSEQVEWLSLVDISGPFLAPALLEQIFPQGLEKVETPRRQRIRSAYEEWRDAVDEGDTQLLEIHAAWVLMVLQDMLEYEDSVLISGRVLDGRCLYRAPETGTLCVPDYAIIGDDGKYRMLVSIWPPETDLEKVASRDSWLASPLDRMTLLCHANDVRLGLVTDGERWMVVNAPVGSTSGHAAWMARLWWQEPVTLKAFQSLLGVRRCFGPSENTLVALLSRSTDFQEEVTDTLGEQVRRAVEILIQSIGRADQDRNGALLESVRPAELYEAGLTVMMRMVFTLCAEERDLLLLGDPIYDQHYAISTLRARLREDADRFGLEVLERRHDAWSRILAVFRAIYGGVEHEALRMPAMGGSLFDPDRFPFLEGRAKGTTWREGLAVPLPIDNRTVLLLLDALQVLEQRAGAQLLSYRALDVEQIGHVYEGLLEYTVAKLGKVTVGLLGSQKVRHPTITLTELESLKTDGSEKVVESLSEMTGRSAAAIRRAVDNTGDDDTLVRLVHACGGDEKLARCLLPFAALIKADSWGTMLVYKPGSFAVVHGPNRRETGTHYTPRSLTESIVERTLEPVVYTGPAEGEARERWKLKPPADILDLKVCDPAMGSGAFLVQACRYLAERLVEAWAREEVAGKVITADGIVLVALGKDDPLPNFLYERLIVARRLVAERCLYGVDINPLAVELAKLSIWLVTMAKGRPFGFLDHNFRSGDSLLGISRLEQLAELSLDPTAMRQGRLFGKAIECAVAEAVDIRHKLHDIPIRDIRDVEAMATFDVDARKKLAAAEMLADALIGVVFAAESAEVVEKRLAVLAAEADRVVKGEAIATEMLAKHATADLSKESPNGEPRHPFHWPLEFPEAFQRTARGFDAVIGNPPFLFGKYVTARHGGIYNRHLAQLNAKSTGNTDLCAHFLWRAYTIISSAGTIGMIATSSIAEGDTRIAGLEQIIAANGTIYCADSKAEWPGTANVYFCMVTIARRVWTGRRMLDGQDVKEISSYLTAVDALDANSQWEPVALAANANLAFYGAIPNGTGFFLERDEAESILGRHPDMRRVLLPFLIGKDLNSASQTASRYAINFWDWSEERANREYPELLHLLAERVKPYRQTLSATKPKLNRDWWLYEANPRGLHEAIGRGEFSSSEDCAKHEKPLERVLAIARVSSTTAFTFVSPDQVFDCQLIVIATDNPAIFGVLQSSVHLVFAWHYGGKMKSDLRYSPTLCVSPFPFPNPGNMAPLAELGESVHQLRQNLLKQRGIGLTELVKLINDKPNRDNDIVAFREQLICLDCAILRAYDWQDIIPDHGFHRVAYLPHGKNVRFTISEAARAVVLRRLSELNHLRHDEENASTSHTKRSSTTSCGKAAPAELGLLDLEEPPKSNAPPSRNMVDAATKKVSTRRTSR